MAENQNYTQDSAEETIDLRKWAGKILINWYWFAISVALFGGGAFLITRYIEKQYVVQATIIVKQDKKSMGTEALFKNLDLFGDQKNVKNEIGILNSWSVVRRALDEVNFEVSYLAVGRLGEMHLYDTIPFRVTLGDGIKSLYGKPIRVNILNDNEYELEINGSLNIHQKQAFNEPFRYEDFSFILSRNPKFDKNTLPPFLRNDQYVFTINNLDKLAYAYRKVLNVALADKEGSMIRLSIQGYNPQQQSDFLNAMMQEYIRSGLEEKNKTAVNTVRFIDEQLTGIVDTLRIAEQSLQDFRSKKQVIDISAEGKSIMTEIERLSQEKALVDVQVQYYEYLLNYLKTNENFTNVMAPSTMGINDQMLTSLISTLVTLSNEKTSLEYSAKENSPALVKVNLQIKANQETVMENVRNLLQTAKMNQTDVNHRVSKVNARISELPATERQLATITRKFELSNQIYTFLLERRAEAGIAEASNVPDNMIVDEARTDDAKIVAPKKSVNYAI
jgi:uncharacterized protein involved in exopolysaccharide biosynthesis